MRSPDEIRQLKDQYENEYKSFGLDLEQRRFANFDEMLNVQRAVQIRLERMELLKWVLEERQYSP